MPFTLAHPAAIIPLKGLRYLAVIPLIIGSMVPDLAIFLPDFVLQRLPASHGKVGTLLLDLPFGLVLVAGLLLLKNPLTAPLWEPHRTFLRNAITEFGAKGTWWLISLPSLFIGTWTHLAWDSCTHRNRWVVRHIPLLQRALTPDAEHRWEVFHVLQYVSSVVGLVLLAVWYLVSLRKSGLVGTGRLWRKGLLAALIFSSLLIGVGAAAMDLATIELSNYTIAAIVSEYAMGSFALLYLAAGVTITRFTLGGSNPQAAISFSTAAGGGDSPPVMSRIPPPKAK